MALGGTGFTFLMTTLGAAMIFIFKKDQSSDRVQRVFLGFAAGVMIAASVWSLLIPSIERAQELKIIGWLPATGGFIIGVLFLMLLDKLIPFFHPGLDRPDGVKKGLKSTSLLVLAVTMHNIPEGMAVGLAFALGAQSNNPETMAAAVALAIGIGIQNFPEGAAISLPLKQEGMGRGKAFICGTLSGIVEPIFGVITVLIAGEITVLLPWLLGFAAGAMLYVVVEELIPEAHIGSGHLGTFGVMAGFLIMMILDVALG